MKIGIVKLAVILFLSVLLNAGCWDSQDIEELALVVGMGLDRHQPDHVEVTFQVARPDLIGGGSQGGSGEDVTAVWVTSTIGNSIFEAVNNARRHFSREIFFGHTQLLVFGEELAREGLGPYLDFIQRETNMRRTIWLAVAEGEAKNVMESKPNLSRIPVVGVVELFGLQERFSLAFTIQLGDFLTALGTPHAGAVVPVVQLVKSVSQEREPMEQEVKETAVFKEDKMVSWLSSRESIGLLWLLGRVAETSVQVNDPLDEKFIVSLDIIRARVDRKVRVVDDKIVYEVRVLTESKIASQTAPHDLSNKDIIQQIEKRLATTIENMMKDTFRKAQELEVDFVGAGEKMSKDLPRQWKEIEKDWDQFFPTVELDVKVNAKVRGTGPIIKPTPYRS